jgi:hypothetical protein
MLSRIHTNRILGLAFLVFLLLMVVGCGPKTDEHTTPPSKYEEGKGTTSVTCLNGVEYWLKYHGHGTSVSPKFSPGKAIPDECTE